MTNPTTPAELRALRLQLKLSQRELAEIACVPKQYISAIETAEDRLPDITARLRVHLRDQRQLLDEVLS